MSEKQKLIVIVGPTASGKTGLSINLAKRLGSEIISADSRQVYKGFDLGSGKVTKKEMQGVLHHCLDICSPRYTCTAELWRRHAEKSLAGIVHRAEKGTESLKKRDSVPFSQRASTHFPPLNMDSISPYLGVPIVVGGTGFYIDALVYGQDFPAVKPDLVLRHELARLGTEELYEHLVALDPERAQTVEQKNPRRLIRAIEIATALGRVPQLGDREAKYDVLWLGLNPPREVLAQKINERLHARLRQGMVAEVRHLHEGTYQAPLSWKRLEHFGLEYRYIAQYLQQNISKEEMETRIARDSLRYARRQMTWFKRNKMIRWYESAEEALSKWIEKGTTSFTRR